MAREYICTRECYFLDRFFREGDRIILDEKQGDSCIHFKRTAKDFSSLQGKSGADVKPAPKVVKTTTTTVVRRVQRTQPSATATSTG